MVKCKITHQKNFHVPYRMDGNIRHKIAILSLNLFIVVSKHFSGNWFKTLLSVTVNNIKIRTFLVKLEKIFKWSSKQ